MDGAAEALLKILDNEGIRRADAVGYSMGGRLALHFALRHPDRVERLVLLSASPGLRTEEERMERRAQDEQRVDEIEDDLESFLPRWYRMPLFRSLDDATREALITERSQNNPAELRKSLEGMGTGAQPSHWEHLHQIRVPAWAIAGANDPKFVAIAQEMADVSLLDAIITPGVGHAIPAERPKVLAETLRGLLS
jgi:2-succinyl-6-hydroxy-2,4-cyclohexadiene-1-carboxylate synthase